MTFWLLAGALILAAVLLCVWPLARGARLASARARRDATVRALYRERLAELEREVAAGQLAPDARDEMAEELGATLLQDYEPAAAGADPVRAPPAVRTALVLGVLLPIASLAVYFGVGEPGAGGLAGADAVLRLDAERDAPALRAWQGTLARRVAERPEDAESWYLLGHTHLKLAQYPDAAEAFAMAHAAFGNDPGIDVYWLQARYLASGGVVDATSRVIAERLLATVPDHPLVLEMFAIDAFRRGDYRESVALLNRALGGDLAPAQRAALDAGLAQARARLADAGPSVEVAVSAAAAVPAGATLFVIARPPAGGMPYAVVRRPGSDLPVSVRLDDAVSMSPAQTLSAASEVQVVVRLSRTGSPMAQPGDWEWRSDVVTMEGRTEPLRLEAHLEAPAAPAPG